MSAPILCSDHLHNGPLPVPTTERITGEIHL